MTSAREKRPAEAETFFRPRRLGHANLFVRDYEKAADFYRDVVGYNEAYRQPDNKASFISNGNTYHDFALTDVTSKYGTENQQPGLNHLAFELETELDLVRGYNEAVAAGVRFDFTMDHDVARSVYATDPGGTMVEIYADVDRNWRENRKGIIIKKKPEWIPGVTGKPLAEPRYGPDPQIDRLEAALFHSRKATHVALVTAAYEAMLDYYTAVVGLTLFAGGPDEAYAVLAGSVCDYALTLYRAAPGLSPGLHHVGIEVWDEADLEASVQRAAGQGVAILSDIDHPARRAVAISDPDGIGLQFFVDRDWSRERLRGLDAGSALALL